MDALHRLAVPALGLLLACAPSQPESGERGVLRYGYGHAVAVPSALSASAPWMRGSTEPVSVSGTARAVFRTTPQDALLAVQRVDARAACTGCPGGCGAGTSDAAACALAGGRLVVAEDLDVTAVAAGRTRLVTRDDRGVVLDEAAIEVAEPARLAVALCNAEDGRCGDGLGDRPITLAVGTRRGFVVEVFASDGRGLRASRGVIGSVEHPSVAAVTTLGGAPGARAEIPAPGLISEVVGTGVGVTTLRLQAGSTVMSVAIEVRR